MNNYVDQNTVEAVFVNEYPDQDLSGFKRVPRKHTFRTDFSKKNGPVSNSKPDPDPDPKPYKKTIGLNSNKQKYLEQLQKARDIALSELQLTKEELLSNNSGDVYRKTVLRCVNKWENDKIWENDEIYVDGLKFSKRVFYLRRDFKNDVNKYYQDLGYISKFILARGTKWVLKVKK